MLRKLQSQFFTFIINITNNTILKCCGNKNFCFKKFEGIISEDLPEFKGRNLLNIKIGEILNRKLIENSFGDNEDYNMKRFKLISDPNNPQFKLVRKLLSLNFEMFYLYLFIRRVNIIEKNFEDVLSRTQGFFDYIAAEEAALINSTKDMAQVEKNIQCLKHLEKNAMDLIPFLKKVEETIS